MKLWAVVLLLIAGPVVGQRQVELELMPGFTGYKGDLIQNHFAVRSMRPALAFNIKYNFDNNFLLRAGVMKGRVVGDDRHNSDRFLKARNLSFQTDLLEFSLCLEYNLLEPEIFYGYPYIFGGIGMYHFDPFAKDDNGQKTYLRPLSTEGQGLPDYPDRKMYSKNQFCLPFGAGWKVNLGSNIDIVYEIGYRILFTDYLDDVSRTYVDPQKLVNARGPKALEMAYRAKTPFAQHEGAQRGNPDVNDWYYFHGIKLLIRLGKSH